MGALIPFAISIAPEIARWVFGSGGDRVVAAVTQTAESLTGTKDVTAQQAAIERDPDLACKMRVELAKLAAQEEEQAQSADAKLVSAYLNDTANARNQLLQLTQARSPIAYGAVIVSAIVLVSFGTVMTLTLTRAIPTGSDTVLNLLLGSLAAMATFVVSYWVGSSAGSARKDDHIARLVSSR